MKRLKFFLLLMLLGCSVASWSYPVSPAHDILNSNAEKTDQVKALIDLATTSRNISLDTSIPICRKAIALAERIGKPEWKSLAYKTQGVNFYFKGEDDSSFYYYEKAIDQFKIINSQIDVGKVYGNIGLIYKRQERYDKALEYYLRNYEVYQKVGYEKGMGSVYNNLGNLYKLDEKLDNAEKHYLLALPLLEKYGKLKEVANVLNNMGVICETRKELDRALEYYEQALDVNSQLEDRNLESILLVNVGVVQEKQKRYDEALENLGMAEQIRKERGDQVGLMNVKYQTGKTLIAKGEFSRAQKYLNEAVSLARELGSMGMVGECYEQFSVLFEKQKQYRKSVQYLKESRQIADSIRNIQEKSHFADLQAKYEADKRQKELELLSQKNQIQELELGKKNAWLFGLLVLVVLGIVAITVSFRINRIRAEHRIMSLQQKVLLSQMNPHFLFNSLTAIQSFILDERNHEANDYLSQLASMVRGVLENSRQEFIPLSRELQTLEEYLSLQNLRFENQLDYQFDVDSSIDPDEIAVPPMLAQPFIENAIQHGELRNNPDARIEVKIAGNGTRDTLLFQITDNGIGIEEALAKQINKKHNSLATTIALDRVKIYNFRAAKRMKFEIIDLKHEDSEKSGTRVTFHIPYKRI